MRTGLILCLALAAQDVRFTDTFQTDVKTLGPTGRNPYFILEPGWRITLENAAKKEVVVITVLEETRKIGGVETRVVEEHESKDGQVVEISRNFFAICARTNAVYYFGEDVDDYKDGKVVGHPGAWLHGEKNARFGLIMPGQPLLGARYYQEVAPGVAMDRAEITGVGEVVETPAGKFENVLRTEETTPLEPGEKSVKRYAPGIGLIEDGGCRLVKAGPKQP
ncbi:MAG TPA: hypothetical protein VF950_01400 [Planctomycetota bacterium]